MTISQPTVSRIVFRVSTLIAGLIRNYIKWPQEEEAKSENQQLFQNLGKGNGAIGLPGVIGAIDCTYIRLTATRFQNMNEIFRNRKGYFSLNVQVCISFFNNYFLVASQTHMYIYICILKAVVGPRTEFLDIVPEWPGSAHDSRIFQNSLLYVQLNND